MRFAALRAASVASSAKRTSMKVWWTSRTGAASTLGVRETPFSDPGGKRREFCSQHKLAGMVNIGYIGRLGRQTQAEYVATGGLTSPIGREEGPDNGSGGTLTADEHALASEREEVAREREGTTRHLVVEPAKVSGTQTMQR